MDQRLELLKRWLKDDAGMALFDIAPASSDASFRRYFRVRRGDESYIVMDAPPEREDCQPYIKVARAMAAIGLNVPHIFRADITQGFLLLSDLGVRSYLEVLDETNVDRLYGDALDALLILQGHRADMKDGLPQYNRQLLSDEMGLFRDWYLQRHLGVVLNAGQKKILDESYEVLTLSALEQPVVQVHRDYHSRNLMVVEDNNPGILDFQDAVIGPVTYDLVSLLRDCYIQWPRVRVEAWAKEYYDRLREEGVIGHVDLSQFIRWFDLMGVQRHLKAIGIFSRLNIRDHKPGYLRDIPRTLGYVIEVSSRYPDLGGLNRLLSEVRTSD